MTSDRHALTVLEPGLLSTVQDLGRRGVGAMGVSPSGAADWFAARAANRLVGNPDDAAVVETTMAATAFEALLPVLVAVTGARASIFSGGVERRPWSSWRCAAGDVLDIRAPSAGARSYIAIEGGISVAPVMGSASTDVVGGYGGRRLQRGDRLAVRPIDATSSRPPLRFPADIGAYCEPPFHLRATEGPQTQAESFGAALEAVLASEYRAGSRSSRQALRLDGPKSALAAARDVLSTGVCAGCVQIAGDALPTVLLAEHQSTGGYPVILCVITADVPRAAQARPGDVVAFERVNLREASDALAARVHALRSLRAAAAPTPVSASRLAGGFFEGAAP